jgi:Zn-dependent peptidase ImmA (M78 family)/predicted secreted protein
MRRRDILDHARTEGSLAAIRELSRLKINLDQAVDIFAIILNANLWLLFQPLEDLLGAYIQEGRGILVNTRRPLSVQRLTAAHEYGHHVLNHRGSLDDESDIERPSSLREAEEAAAFAFASDFLMPLQLINGLWKELHFTNEIDSYHAYLLSLYTGTSYKATVYQLAKLGKIASQQATDMLKATPKLIKRQIGHGIGPGNPWAEVWPVEEDQSDKLLQIAIEDEISVNLSESPSTGFIWVVDMNGLLDLREEEHKIEVQVERDASLSVRRDGDGALLPVGLLRSVFDPMDHNSCNATVGGRGNRYVDFRALRTGDCDVRLKLRRPWQSESESKGTFTIRLHIKNRPTGDADRGYLDETKEADLAIR